MAERCYLVIANGQWSNLEPWHSLTENSSKIIACDGAAARCIENGIHFDVVLGDMDSLPKKIQTQISDNQNIQLILDKGQQENDLVKALKWAIKDGAEHIDILGVEGGETDHQFAAILALCEIQHSARIYTTKSTIEMIDKSGYKNCLLPRDSTFSLFAIGEVSGLSVSGCEWNLENQTMKPGTQGLHNRVTQDCLEVHYASGQLLLFLNC